MRWKKDRRGTGNRDSSDSVDWLIDMKLDNIFSFGEILRRSAPFETAAHPDPAEDADAEDD